MCHKLSSKSPVIPDYCIHRWYTSESYARTETLYYHTQPHKRNHVILDMARELPTKPPKSFELKGDHYETVQLEQHLTQQLELVTCNPYGQR